MNGNVSLSLPSQRGSGASGRDELDGHPIQVVPAALGVSRGSFRAGKTGRQIVNGQAYVLEADENLTGYTYRSGNVAIMVVNDELFVNYKNYGPLEPGAAILVDNGRVSVDGRRRPETTGRVRIRREP